MAAIYCLYLYYDNKFGCQIAKNWNTCTKCLNGIVATWERGRLHNKRPTDIELRSSIWMTEQNRTERHKQGWAASRCKIVCIGSYSLALHSLMSIIIIFVCLPHTMLCLYARVWNKNGLKISGSDSTPFFRKERISFTKAKCTKKWNMRTWKTYLNVRL